MSVDPILLQRVKSGKGLVIFGFDPENSKTNESVDALRTSLPECFYFSVPEYLEKITNTKRIESILVDVESARQKIQENRPTLITVRIPLENLAAAKGNIFDDDLLLERVCIADMLVSLSKTDLFVVPNAQSLLEVFDKREVPQTPIERKLSEAMSEIDLQFKKQVRIGRFTADFLVSQGSASVVVEADGAEFHDAKRDKDRDKEILDEHGYKVLRFSGSRIFYDAQVCAQEVARFLRSLSIDQANYRFEDLQQLDASQQKAVKHGNGHARVLAPAGSGKTRVLVNRISYLLNSGVQPGSILALAFNRKAARQLEERLSQLGVPVAVNLTDRSGVAVATFNSFGYRLLMSNGFKGEILSSEPQVKKLVREALEKAGINMPTVRGFDNLNRVIKQLARVCRGLVDPNAEQIEFAVQKGETLKQPFPPIYTAIRECQESRRRITFDDQIFNALSLVVSEPLVRHELQRRFQHILVDEYQDLNKAQIYLIRMLASGGAKLFAVGDDDQLIYSWREAKTQHLLEDFEKFFSLSTTYALETNYRCAMRIVEPSQRLIAFNKNRFPKVIKPSPRAPEGAVTVEGADSLKAQGQIMVNFLKIRHRPGACDWKDMAVLSRTKVQLIEVARALDSASVPRSSLPRIPLFSSPIGRVLLGYLRIVNSPDEAGPEDYGTIINRPNRYVTNEFRERLLRSEHPLKLLVKYVENEFPSGQSYRADPVKKLIDDLRAIHGTLNDRSVFETIKAVVSTFTLETINSEGKVAEHDDPDDASLLEIIAEEARQCEFLDLFIEHYEKQTRRETPEDGDAGEEEKSTLDSMHDKEAGGNVVSLNTIHSTKGKEWGLVVIFDACGNPLGGARNAKVSSAEIEEERRVFYVGMTRAEQSLAIMTRNNRPSLFLWEAFISPEIEQEGLANAEEELHRREADLGAKVGGRTKLLNERRRLDDKINHVKSGMLILEMKAQMKEIDGEKHEVAEEIKEWGQRAPDGFLKRIVSGGFSGRDIERRISGLTDKHKKFEADYGDLAEKVSRGEAFEKEKLNEIEVEIAHVDRQIVGYEVKIEGAEAKVNDAKNIYNVFRLFLLAKQ